MIIPVVCRKGHDEVEVDVLAIAFVGGDSSRPVFVGVADQYLINDRVAPDTMTGWHELEAVKRGSEVRGRFQFACERCSESFPAREEKLAKCALLLLSSRQRTVDLSTLRGMLARV